MLVRSRPSSHSYDSTIVLRFDRAERAKVAARKINRDRVARSAAAYGRLLVISFADGAWDEPYATLDEIGWDGDYEEYRSYQELTVKIEVPAGASPETMAVVLDPARAALFQRMARACDRMRVVRTGNAKVASFRYCGEAIYRGEFDGKHFFHFGDRALLVEKGGVDVKVHIWW